MNKQIELEATYPHPPERVWQALVEPAAIKQWLMPTNFRPLIGFRFRFDKGEGRVVKGVVTDVDPGRLLAYRWDDEDGQESIVVWRLSPVDGGTRVHLEHVPLEQPIVTSLAIDAYFNWAYALTHGLPSLLRLLQAQNDRLKPPMVFVDEPALTVGAPT